MFFVGARGFQCAVLCFLGARLCAAEVTLRGRVVDEANAPVAGATISLRLAGQSQTSSPATQATADPTGAFHVSLAQPGSYLVTASQPDFFRLVDHPVELREGLNEILLSLNHTRNTTESIDVRSSPSP